MKTYQLLDFMDMVADNVSSGKATVFPRQYHGMTAYGSVPSIQDITGRDED